MTDLSYCKSIALAFGGILLTACRSGQNNLLWRRRLDSIGAVPYSGVGICTAEDLVFITAAARYSPALQPPPGRVAALKRSDGSPMWVKSIGTANLSTPFSIGTLLIVADFRDHLYALERASGQLVWQRDLTPYGNMMGINQQVPVADNELLYLRCPLPSRQEMTLVCLTMRGGQTLWKRKFGWGSMALTAGRVLYLLQSSGTLFAINGHNGRVLNSLRIHPEKVLSLSCIDDDVVCVSPGSLFRLDGRTFRTKWRTDLSAFTSTFIHKLPLRCEQVMSVVGDRVYVWLGNTIWAVDGLSGRLLWQHERKGEIDPCLVSIDDNVLTVGHCTDNLAEIDVLACLDGKTERRLTLRSVRPGYRLLTTVDGRMYVLTYEEIYCQYIA